MPRTKKAPAAPANSMIAYMRVSREDQVRSGLGLADQRAQIERAAAANGWTIVEWRVDEAVSGRLDSRPELDAALEGVRTRRAEGIVAAKLDRLMRSVAHTATLIEDAKRHGYNLVLLDIGLDLKTSAGKMVAAILAVSAEIEVDKVSERTKAALAAKKAQGARLGREPVMDPALVARIVGAHAAGQGYSAIARTLNTDGVPTARGGARWYPSTVQKVIDWHARETDRLERAEAARRREAATA